MGKKDTSFPRGWGRVFASMIALAAIVPLSAKAAYPDRPIHIIVPNAAGSNSDIITRLLAPKLQDILGQPVVVENRPGGNEMIGANVVAKALPDGYTILFGTASNMAGNMSLFKDMPYNPVKDFSGVGMIAQLPYVLVADPSLGINSVQDLIKYVKSKPKQLNYASTTGGSFMAGAILVHDAGIEITNVPFNSGPQAFASMMGHEVVYMLYPFQALSPLVKSGQLKALATSGGTRPSWLPDVPTMVEAGYKDFNFTSWVALYVPVKTPRDIVDKLGNAMSQALKDPDLLAKYAQAGTIVTPMTPAETDKFTESEAERYRGLVAMSGAKAN